MNRYPFPLLRQSCPRLLFGMAFLCLLAPGSSAADYEHERPRKATDVLPAALIAGDLWKVGDEAIPDQGLFEFQVETPWGAFPVYGEAMLRLRLREFTAIAQLQAVSNTEAALHGAGKSAKQSFVRLGHAVIHPKQTARALPQGTRRLFTKLDRYAGKIKAALVDSGEPKTEVDKDDSKKTSAAAAGSAWLARKYGGVGTKSRDLSRDLSVDPYTSNELLAAEVDRVASAQAVGSVSSKILMPAIAGALGLMATASNIAYTDDWREIFLYNAKQMRAMGVGEELILRFKLNKFYTPMTQVMVVAMLDAMEGVQDRWVVIEQASLLENESEALFFLESVMLAEWYHREESPLETFITDTLIPVARTKKGNLVAFTAADYFYWTQEAAQVTGDFTAIYVDHPGSRTLVMADYISSRAREEVEALGWTVISDLRMRYDVEVPWGKQNF
jgi:hypothetical protein